MNPTPVGRSGTQPGAFGLTGAAGLQLKPKVGLAGKKYGLQKPKAAKANVFGAAAEAEETETEEDEDEGFDAFQRRVSVWPEQALRFCRSGGPTERPLWLSGKRRAPPPPPCGRCGAARRFEFQVMPQLLCSLEAEEDLETLAAEAAAEAKGGGSPDALDWGTVAVYTCSASCAAPEGAASTYADEFVWHQPV